jgi:carnitine O-acetyltransferase
MTLTSIYVQSAATRKYALGRTEVIRTASNESKAWAEAMLDPEQSVRASSLVFKCQLNHPQDAHRAELFRAAVKRHAEYSAWAADGQGVDRHLFGLKKARRCPASRSNY